MISQDLSRRNEEPRNDVTTVDGHVPRAGIDQSQPIHQIHPVAPRRRATSGRSTAMTSPTAASPATTRIGGPVRTRDLDCTDWRWAPRSADERRWLDASYGHK